MEKGGEKENNPHNPEHVENKVKECRLPRRDIPHRGGYDSSNRGTDILAKYHSCRHREVYPPISTHQQRECHGGRRGLYDDGEQNPEEYEKEYGPNTKLSILREGLKDVRVLRQIRHRVLKKCKPEEEEREAED